MIGVTVTGLAASTTGHVPSVWGTQITVLSNYVRQALALPIVLVTVAFTDRGTSVLPSPHMVTHTP